MKKITQRFAASFLVCVDHANCRWKRRIDTEKVEQLAARLRRVGFEIIEDDHLDSLSSESVEVSLDLLCIIADFSVKEAFDRIRVRRQPCAPLAIFLRIQGGGKILMSSVPI